MIDPNDELLLQARLDGELTHDEAARLDERLSASLELRERAAELDRIARALDELEAQDPPVALSHNILAFIAASAEARHRQGKAVNPAAGDRPQVGTLSGLQGTKLARKLAWGISAVAAVVLAALWFTGYPAVPAGTESTVGADRPQTREPDTDGTDPGDADAEVFLESDAFAALKKDAGAKKLLSSPAVVTALQDPAIAKVLRAPVIVEVLRSPAIADALGDPMFAETLRNPAFADALRKQSFAEALRTPAFAQALTHPAFLEALRNPRLVEALRDPALAAALVNPALRETISDPAMRTAFQGEAFQAALRSPGFTAALTTEQFREAIAER